METTIKTLCAEINRLEKYNKYLLRTHKQKEMMLNKMIEDNRRINEALESTRLQYNNRIKFDHEKNAARGHGSNSMWQKEESSESVILGNSFVKQHEANKYYSGSSKHSIKKGGTRFAM